jgi:hypothetical protein
MPNEAEQPQPRRTLEGRWRKLTDDQALNQYPAEIRFAEDTYLGQRGDQQGMIWWDAGIYRLDEPTTLVLSTATDEMVSYRMRLRGKRLSVEVPDKGTVVYERVEDAPS